MSKMQNMSDEQIRKAIETFNKKLPLIPEGEDRDLCLVGLENFQNELARRNQKKTESQPIEKIEQLPDREQQIEQQNKAAWYEEKRVQNQATDQEQSEKAFDLSGTKIEKLRVESKSENFISEKEYWDLLPSQSTNFKTIKAPVIDREPEYINIELIDQKGDKYIRTYNRAQVKSLCRKYFSNVHNAWAGGNRKLTNGFNNLLAYFLGWIEFDGKTPGLQDVLQDYFRYKKASEKSEDSEAFKVAKELYDKIISVITKPQQDENK